MQPTCVVCNSPLNLIPAGISKTTNRPYNAFYACPNKHPQGNRTTPQAPVAPQNQPITREVVQSPDWDEIARGKVRNSVAVAFIGLRVGETALPTADDDVKGVMEDWVDWIMGDSKKENKEFP